MLSTLPIGVALQGVTRRGGKASPDEDSSGARRRVESGGGTVPSTNDGATRLLSVATELRSRSGASSFVRRWQEAVQTNMRHKKHTYTRERDSMRAEVDNQQSVVTSFVRAARSGGADDALADSQTSTWDVAEKVSSRWQSLVLQSASLDRLIRRAQERFDLMNNATDFAMLRAEFAVAIERLATDFRSQSVLLDAVCDVIEAFVKNPLVGSNAYLNFVLMGRPGVGKTRLATSLASVLGKLGILIYDDVVVCGRSDFVAEYEGQTTTKSRTFLMANLEKCAEEPGGARQQDHMVCSPRTRRHFWSAAARNLLGQSFRVGFDQQGLAVDGAGSIGRASFESVDGLCEGSQTWRGEDGRKRDRDVEDDATATSEPCSEDAVTAKRKE